MTTGLELLLRDEAIIYVAGRLFDIEDKLKSELLEAAVLKGVRDAATRAGLPTPPRPTFVPFRDAGQEELVADDKTRQLFDMDLARLRRTVLLVSYIDGLAKDEGICFEIGYAYMAGAVILLISTDFFDIEMPSGEALPLDPLLREAATHLIRRPQLAESSGTFHDMLLASRALILTEVRSAVCDLLSRPHERLAHPESVHRTAGHLEVLIDFGGSIYEWQALLLDKLEALVGSSSGVRLVRTGRYDALPAEATDRPASPGDLDALAHVDILVTCTDADEAPAGTAILQGAMCAMGRPVWMYNSKRTAILASGGYRSSRNLMLDYSATRVFRTLTDLAAALRKL
jgi:nucleoside 2-deoxyribosyltransferase